MHKNIILEQQCEVLENKAKLKQEYDIKTNAD